MVVHAHCSLLGLDCGEGEAALPKTGKALSNSPHISFNKPPFSGGGLPRKKSPNGASDYDSWGDLEADNRLNLLYVNKSDSGSVFERHLESNHPDLHEKYKNCGKRPLGFGCADCGKRWYLPNSCGIRGCPVCGRYQLARFYRRYLPAVRGIPQHRLRKVELTYGHMEGMNRDKLNAVYGDFQRVLNSYWDTYVVGLEVSPGGHVHCHALVAGRYVGQKTLSRRAAEVMDRPVVWIRRGGKLRYMLKDVAKAPEFKTEQLRVAYFEATRGLRMFRSRGGLYGLGGGEKRFVCPDCGGGLLYEGDYDESWNCSILYRCWYGSIPPPAAA
jgi:hypothetical protein